MDRDWMLIKRIIDGLIRGFELRQGLEPSDTISYKDLLDTLRMVSDEFDVEEVK